ncbi:MAG: hypothetical protein KIT84_04735 [Labilithrix sp.]|nr:hypothetical protein [Labilithrix sp.]
MAALGPSTPPLVVVAAALATKDGTYVAEYEHALEYLSPADRAVAARMMEERPMKLRVAAAPQLADEGEERQEQEDAPRRMTTR